MPDTKPAGVRYFGAELRAHRACHELTQVQLMAEQVDRLIECAQHPAVVLQVLPFNAGDHAGTDGPVTLYEFADRTDVAYAEGNRGGRVVEDRAEVAELVTVLDMVRSNALSPRATLDMLATIRRELDEPRIP